SHWWPGTSSCCCPSPTPKSYGRRFRSCSLRRELSASWTPLRLTQRRAVLWRSSHSNMTQLLSMPRSPVDAPGQRGDSSVLSSAVKTTQSTSAGPSSKLSLEAHSSILAIQVRATSSNSSTMHWPQRTWPRSARHCRSLKLGGSTPQSPPQAYQPPQAEAESLQQCIPTG